MESLGIVKQNFPLRLFSPFSTNFIRQIPPLLSCRTEARGYILPFYFRYGKITPLYTKENLRASKAKLKQSKVV